LARLKSADRKSNTVGDIVVTQSGTPFEAVEIKYGQPITFAHVSEAIEKVRALTVRRYYMLSTEDVEESEIDRIRERKDDFLKQNGCELILNGILASLSYYLRLLPDTTDFVMNYATLVETDQDTSYEHRIGWNACCQSI
jgi:DNA (cytosine-5)-methyltransferase 1